MRVLSWLFRSVIVVNRRVCSWIRLTFYNIAFYPQFHADQGVILQNGVRISVTDGGTITIGRGTTICSGSVLVAKNGSISVGRDSFLGSNMCIVSRESITIGDDALIAERVSIRDQNHGMSVSQGRKFRTQPLAIDPIEIGENVWIGAGCFVAAGAVIADNTVVASNSVVTSSLSEGQLYAGAPAVVKRKLID